MLHVSSVIRNKYVDFGVPPSSPSTHPLPLLPSQEFFFDPATGVIRFEERLCDAVWAYVKLSNPLCVSIRSHPLHARPFLLGLCQCL